jgi:hypothetical protein
MAFCSSWRRQPVRLPTRRRSRAPSRTGVPATRFGWDEGRCASFASAMTMQTNRRCWSLGRRLDEPLEA